MPLRANADTPSQVLEVIGPPARPQTTWQMTVSPGAAHRSCRIQSLYPGVIWSK